ncbi:MAG: hypothetical protein AAF702_18420 [Chloroflexota bacterium]
MTSPVGNSHEPSEGIQPRKESVERDYRAYILRCWSEQYDDSPIWRFSLEEIPSGQRMGFSNLTAVADFLRKQIENKGEQTMIDKRSPMITMLLVILPYVLLLTLATLLMNVGG